jgi:D-mannonate dehydratase
MLLYHLTEENKMVTKEQIDRIVDAIESIPLAEDIITKASDMDYNNIAYIGQQLERIATVLENWEQRTRG